MDFPKSIEDNLELIRRINGFDNVEAVVNYHASVEWWVGTVGFIAGLPVLMPLDPNFRLQAPKYDPPRTWTPPGTVALGGGFTALYPMETPDGYQMLGRTPLKLFEPNHDLNSDLHGGLSRTADKHGPKSSPRNGADQLDQAPFEQSPALLSVGDRVKFVPISEAQLEAIEQDITAGRYRYSISAPQAVSLEMLQRLLPQAA